MTRPLEVATKTALGEPIIPLAAIVYLDILNDPFFGWTGIGDLTFAANETGDPSLDTKTFVGLANIVEISGISEGAGGSDSLEISFPGVDPQDTMMKQIITDRRRWQFRRAIVWLLVLHPDTMAIQGKPFRIKTGRMDGAPYDDNNDKGVIKIVVEGQASYGSEPLNSRYSEQINIDSTDISNKYVYALANQSATFGTKSAAATSGAVGGNAGPLARIASGSGFFSALIRRAMGIQ